MCAQLCIRIQAKIMNIINTTINMARSSGSRSKYHTMATTHFLQSFSHNTRT